MEVTQGMNSVQYDEMWSNLQHEKNTHSVKQCAHVPRQAQTAATRFLEQLEAF